MDTSLFRPTALAKLMSPERLDTLMKVTSTRGWIALGAMGVLVVAGSAWGFIGRVPDTVVGQGVILRESGLYSVQSTGGGPLVTLEAPLGTEVKAGQVIATISQPQTELSIRRAQSQLEAAQQNRTDIGSRLNRSTQLQLGNLDSQRRQLEQSSLEVQARIDYLDERVIAEREAVTLGLITNSVLQATVAQRAAARDQLVGSQVQLEQLDSREVTLETDVVRQVFTLDAEIRRLESELTLLQRQFEDFGTVKSTYNGIVVEHLVTVGDAINVGQTILNIEPQDQPIRAFVFVVEGKRVVEGMTARLLPEGISSEEFGYILGRVRSVSQTPLSPAGMNRVVRNQSLVNLFQGGGGAHLVIVEVDLDPTTPSGLSWSTRRGPDLRFGSGTVLRGTVVVREQPPAALVIPKLREWLGV